MKLILCVLSLALLTACAAQPALITDASTDSVKVQATAGTKESDVIIKGKEACNFYNRDAFGPVSKRCLDNYCVSYVALFMCRPR